jgi:hypothetical protein
MFSYTKSRRVAFPDNFRIRPRGPPNPLNVVIPLDKIGSFKTSVSLSFIPTSFLL